MTPPLIKHKRVVENLLRLLKERIPIENTFHSNEYMNTEPEVSKIISSKNHLILPTKMKNPKYRHDVSGSLGGTFSNFLGIITAVKPQK